MTAQVSSLLADFDIGRLNWGEGGLLPAIVQDAQSKDVLMLAYMNRESLAKTVETGETWFWSRSRGALWHKGATSGHTQRVKAIRIDCDADTLLVLVEPAGPACHNGTYSCFSDAAASGRAFAAGAAGAAGIAPGTGDAAVPGASDASAPGTGDAAVPGASDPADRAAVADDTPAARTGDRFAILSALESVIARRDAERPEGAYTTYLFEKGIDKILKKVGEESAEVIIAAKNASHDELRYEASDLIYHLLVLLRHARLPLDDVLGELARRHAAK